MRSTLQRQSSTPAAENTSSNPIGQTATPPEFSLQSSSCNENQEEKAAKSNEKVAKIHIHADIDAEKMGLGELLNGQVGHAWVSLEWNDPTQISDRVKNEHPDHAGYLSRRAGKGMFADPFGFWPYMFSDYDEALDQWSGAPDRVSYSSNPFDSYVKGQVVHPDNLHEKSVRATQSFDITEDQAVAAMDYEKSRQGADYSVFWYNCTTFAAEAVKAAGKTPPGNSTLGIAYPNKLYNKIVKNQKKGVGTTHVRDTTGNNTTVEGPESKRNR